MAVKLFNKSAVIAVSAASITLSDAPRAQDNLSKLLTALSTIAAPSAGPLYQICAHILKGAGARGGDGGERGKQL